MLTVHAAIAPTSARPPIQVTRREILWEGGIVEIEVPITAKRGEFTDELGCSESYLYFFRTIQGGVVNCFVRIGDDSCLGRKIVARVRVLQKVLADGRSYNYIDFFPVSDGVVTHRLAIMTGDSSMWPVEQWVIFDTPAPLRGVIILAPPDAKIIPNQSASSKLNVGNRHLVRSTSGDSQLERLLREGWEIESQDEERVILTKTPKPGNPVRRMTHYPPKKKK